MQQILLVIHLIIAVALVGSILVQKSEGGGLASGASGGMGSFMTPRGSANLLTRTTGILAACFFVTSIGLAILAGSGRSGGPIITDQPGNQAPPIEFPVPDVPLNN